MKIVEGCASDIGSVRESNQDRVCCMRFDQGGESIGLFAVCDGIGGLEHGEIASSLLTDHMKEWFENLISWVDIGKTEPAILFSHLKDAAESWNEELCRWRAEHNVKTGSTMSLLLLVQRRYYIIHVGDSRVYRYRENFLEQLTTDNSVARLTNGKMKAYLNNYVGKQEQLWFQALEGTVEKADLFIVCSDGLYHHLLPQDLEALDNRRCQDDLNRLCANLVQTMMQRGEKDNISVCLALAE